MKLGSLFDGSGTFPLAATLCGIEPVWASEIEKFPIQVTTKRFPNMKHLGDITKINGAEIESVDIITFGSPCQDLSVAGKRAGLDGERSNLFVEAIRIIREMREATKNEYPRFAIWENVPGAFSSNKGYDFRTVLEEIAESDIPIPEHGKWATAGMVELSDRQIAWRVLDSQYWGVPQRRKRIFLVADFRGKCANKILFKPESLFRNIAESVETRERVTKDFERGIDETGRSIGINGNVAGTLDANYYKGCGMRGDREREVVITYDSRGNDDSNICCTLTCDYQNRITDYKTSGFDRYNQCVTRNVSPTLKTPQGGDDIHLVIHSNNTSCRHTIAALNKVTNTISTNNNPSGSKTPLMYSLCSLASNSMKSINPNSGCRKVDVARTLDTSSQDPSKNQGGIAVVYGMAPKQYSQNIFDNVSPPLMSNDYKEPNVVASGFSPDNSITAGSVSCEEEKTATLSTTKRLGVAFTCNQRDEIRDLRDSAGSLQARLGMKQKTFYIQGNMIGRDDKNGPRGDGINENLSFTLNATDRHAVAYTPSGFSQCETLGSNSEDCGDRSETIAMLASGKNSTGTIMASCSTKQFLGNQEAFSGDYHIVQSDVTGLDCRNGRENSNLCGTLQAKESGGFSYNCTHPVRIGNTVRRLTPTEYARLQGFPDWWCADVPHSDTAAYKMWGNGMSLPCVLYIMENIVSIGRNNNKLMQKK